MKEREVAREERGERESKYENVKQHLHTFSSHVLFLSMR